MSWYWVGRFHCRPRLFSENDWHWQGWDSHGAVMKVCTPFSCFLIGCLYFLWQGKKLVASALRDSKFTLVSTTGRSSPVKDTVSLLSGVNGNSSNHSDSSTTSSEGNGDVELGSFGFGTSSSSKPGPSKVASDDDGWGSSSSFSSAPRQPAPASSSGSSSGVSGGSDGWGSSSSSTGRVYGGRYG